MLPQKSLQYMVSLLLGRRAPDTRICRFSFQPCPSASCSDEHTLHGTQNQSLTAQPDCCLLLAERIKFLRRSKGWSQEQLAERASM